MKHKSYQSGDWRRMKTNVGIKAIGLRKGKKEGKTKLRSEGNKRNISDDKLKRTSNAGQTAHPPTVCMTLPEDLRNNSDDNEDSDPECCKV